MEITSPTELAYLASAIKSWGYILGFGEVRIAEIDIEQAESNLRNWLARGFHGEMHYMAAHGTKRSRPHELVPGTVRVICVRMDYLSAKSKEPETVLNIPTLGYISRYALGRDYHKLMRKRLQQLANRIESAIGPFGYRAFVDSAPVMEKPLAQNAGIGWIGKHTNILSQDAGSWFFLGELYTDLPLPSDKISESHCGSCRACIDICPTQAIVAPYQLDARRCISYLTIELKGSIPEPLRPLIGNRIYGCDDCQLICPWNRFAKLSDESDFAPRQELDASRLIDLFAWSEPEFFKRTEGSAIRRIGYNRWLRNIAVALGNAPKNPDVVKALKARSDHPSSMVREHVAWALNQQENVL
ncbi:tRNA epoxyqueuosine(34) reductase QueG [Acidihalobacter prosperus]